MIYTHDDRITLRQRRALQAVNAAGMVMFFVNVFVGFALLLVALVAYLIVARRVRRG